MCGTPPGKVRIFKTTLSEIRSSAFHQYETGYRHLIGASVSELVSRLQGLYYYNYYKYRTYIMPYTLRVYLHETLKITIAQHVYVCVSRDDATVEAKVLLQESASSPSGGQASEAANTTLHEVCGMHLSCSCELRCATNHR